MNQQILFNKFNAIKYKRILEKKYAINVNDMTGKNAKKPFEHKKYLLM